MSKTATAKRVNQNSIKKDEIEYLMKDLVKGIFQGDAPTNDKAHDVAAMISGLVGNILQREELNDGENGHSPCEDQDVSQANEESVHQNHRGNKIENQIIPLEIFLHENGDSLVAKFCCAGLSKKDVVISTVDDKVLVSKAEYNQSFEFQPFYGNFVKDNIKAKMERGILLITIEKTPANKPVEIKIS